MPDPRVTFLDVGHGLCAVLEDEQGVVMFDVPGGDAPRRFLRQRQVSDIDAIFVSHAHADHSGGVTGFIGDDYRISRVFLNPPRADETRLFDRLALALDEARRAGAHRPSPLVLQFDTDCETPALHRGRIRIAIVGPDSVASRTRREPGGRRRIQTEHSLCGVARIDYQDRPRVLLTGDLNDRGLAQLTSRGTEDLRADVLVYPHHGGTSDVADEHAFAHDLASIVRPDLVVFSLERNEDEDARHRPHLEVLQGLRRAVPDAHIVCTQLSRGCHCSPLTLLTENGSLAESRCCAGDIEVVLQREATVFPKLGDHLHFVDEFVVDPGPLCRACDEQVADVAG
jgi:beta-lactamase superfamily II metal-dependent hydrolase